MRNRLVLVVALLLLWQAPVAAAEYLGPLYDTHAHWDEDDAPDRLAALGASYGVERTILFAHVDPDDVAGSMDDIREAAAPHPNRFVLFFHVDPKRPDDAGVQRLERVTAATPGVFAGFGESAFYRDPWIGHRIDEEPWPSIFAYAAEHDLTVMVHLTPDQGDALASMLTGHPDTRVLLHGWELQPELPQLLADHSNLWYTLDTATLLTLDDDTGPRSLLFPGPESDDPVGDFTATFDAHRDEMLARAVTDWLPVIEAAPDRIVWGTDASSHWHFDDAVFSRLVSFSRDFIDELPAETRGSYAWANADGAWGEGVTLAAPERSTPGPAPLAAWVLAIAAVLVRRRSRQPPRPANRS